MSALYDLTVARISAYGRLHGGDDLGTVDGCCFIIADHTGEVRVSVTDGEFQVEEAHDGAAYTLRAGETTWEAVLSGGLDLMQAVGQGLVTVEGDAVSFGAEADRVYTILDGGDRWAAVSDVPRGAEISTTDGIGVIGQYAIVKGIRTYFERSGKEGLPYIVALHTAGRDCRQWQRVGELLGDQWQLLAVDLPGHGKSWPARGARALASANELVDFLAEFIETVCGSEQVVLMGCSLGGNLTFRFGGTYPGLVRGLIALEGADYSSIASTDGLRLMDNPRINPKSFFRPRTFSLTGRDCPAQSLDYLLWEAESYDGASIRADMHAYITGDSRQLTSRISSPMLVVRGQDDWMVTDEMVDSAVSRVDTNVPVTVVKPEGVGHFPHVENPTLVAELVSSFISSI